MTYQLNFLREDGSRACFFVTECGSDDHAKAIAQSLLRTQYAGVEIVRGEDMVYKELKARVLN
jgi:hypothetical protein